jgi:hypothetical protein
VPEHNSFAQLNGLSKTAGINFSLLPRCGVLGKKTAEVAQSTSLFVRKNQVDTPEFWG